MQYIVQLVVSTKFEKNVKGFFFWGENGSWTQHIFFQNVIQNLNDLNSSDSQFGPISVGHSELLKTFVNKHLKKSLELIDNFFVLG